MTTGRLISSWVLWAMFILALPGLVEAQSADQDARPLPPAAVGSAGAADQVENWIRENLAGMREEGAAEPATKPGTEPGTEFGIGTAQPPEAPTAPGPPDLPGQATPGLAASGMAAPDLAAPGGSVNWAVGSMSFTAQEFVAPDSLNPARDKAMALRRATLRARKALLDAVLSLPLDGRRNVGGALNDAELAAVQTYLQNSRIQQQEAGVEGGGTRLSVTALADLRDDFAELLMPGTEPFLGGLPGTIRLTGPPVPEPGLDPEQNAYRTSMVELGGFTGLVVDVRGLGMAPALLPVVADPAGLAAFGPFQVAREDAVRSGAALYATHPKASLVTARVGSSPLVVRALAISGRNKADVVISTQDAVLVRTLFKNQDVRSNCRAAIILD